MTWNLLITKALLFAVLIDRVKWLGFLFDWPNPSPKIPTLGSIKIKISNLKLIKHQNNEHGTGKKQSSNLHKTINWLSSSTITISFYCIEWKCMFYSIRGAYKYSQRIEIKWCFDGIGRIHDTWYMCRTNWVKTFEIMLVPTWYPFHLL